jgi:hypothetical protein
MHVRRLACFILGMWLAAGLAVAWLEREDFQALRTALAQPDPAVAGRVKVLGAQETFLLMGRLEWERRQRTTENWESVQLIIGVGFFLFLLLGTREGKLPLGMALLLVGMVVLERFLLTPEVLSLERVADFTPGRHASAESMRRLALSLTQEGFEIAIWTVQAALAAVMIVPRHRRSGDAGDQFYVVDKANNRHVNR